MKPSAFIAITAVGLVVAAIIGVGIVTGQGESACITGGPPRQAMPRLRRIATRYSI